MKKAILILGILLLTTILVFAGGKKEDTTGKVTLSFWHPYGEGSWSSDYIDSVISDFTTAHPNIAVKSQSFPDYAAIIEALQRGVAGGQLPSIATIGYGYERYILGSGKAHPYNNYLSNNFREDFFEKVLDVTTFNNDVYGVPFALSVPVIFYHSDVFEKAGLDPDNPPTTWAEFIQVSKILRDKLGIYGATFALDDPWAFECLLRSRGGEFLSKDNELLINSPAAKNLLADWGKGAKDNYFLYNADFFETLQTFSAKQVGMFVVSSYGTLLYHDTAPEILVSSIPTGSASDEVKAAIGGNALYLFGNDEKEREAAALFVDFFTGPENNALWAMNSGYLPTRKSSLEEMGAFMEGFDNYQKIVSYIGVVDKPTQWPERHVLRINQYLMEAIESVMIQQSDAETSLEEAYRKINPLLK
ncbi:MAG: extracellular solute-binding protein [Sphaerochaetaceae bacterium]